MEDALPILEYLPVSFQRQQDSDYIQFLWQSFETNYENEKYQFSVLACHMLFMSYIYFSVWQIKHSHGDQYKQASIFLAGRDLSEDALINLTSPFSFSKINERTIFRMLRLIGCEPEQLKPLQRLVNDRNEIAHSNGHIFYNDPSSADEKIGEILSCMSAVQEHMVPVIHECLCRFLSESWDIEERRYSEASDQIREELVHAHYFSQKDIEACLAFDIDTLSGHEHFAEIEALFNVLKIEFGNGDDDEWMWDTETRLAVVAKMQVAEWIREDKTIVFHDPENLRSEKVVSSREELVSYLEEEAATTFCAHCPRDSGEYLFECDENSVVEGVLADYEDQIEKVFGEE